MSTKEQIIKTTLDIARGELGVKEVGNNSGARVRQYQASTTLGGSFWPWCAAFDSWTLKEAAEKLGIEIEWSNSASCDVIWADGKARGLIRATPQKGDIFLVRAKIAGGYSKSDAIHTGFVEDVEGLKFTTIEGNTNNDGGREGVAVMRHNRDVSNRYVFVRWVDAVKLGEPVPEWKVEAKHGGKTVLLPSFNLNGTNFVKAKALGDLLGYPVEWNADDGEVLWNGQPIPQQPRLVGGASYFPVRLMAELAKMALSVSGRVVTFS